MYTAHNAITVSLSEAPKGRPGTVRDSVVINYVKAYRSIALCDFDHNGVFSAGSGKIYDLRFGEPSGCHQFEVG